MDKKEYLVYLEKATGLKREAAVLFDILCIILKGQRAIKDNKISSADLDKKFLTYSRKSKYSEQDLQNFLNVLIEKKMVVRTRIGRFQYRLAALTTRFVDSIVSQETDIFLKHPSVAWPILKAIKKIIETGAKINYIKHHILAKKGILHSSCTNIELNKFERITKVNIDSLLKHLLDNHYLNNPRSKFSRITINGIKFQAVQNAYEEKKNG